VCYGTEYYAVHLTTKYMHLECSRILSCSVSVLIPRIGRPNFNPHLLLSFPYMLYPETFLLSTDFSPCYLQFPPKTSYYKGVHLLYTYLIFRGYLDSVVGIASRHRLDGSVVRTPLWAIFSTPVVPGLSSDHSRHREYGEGGGDGHDRKDTPSRSYRKQPLLLK